MILVPDMLESQSRALKTRMTVAFSKKNLSEKIGSLHWRVRPGIVAQNAPACGAPQENPKPKTEKIFSVETRCHAESLDGLNTSRATGYWRVMELQSLVKKVVSMRVKGFTSTDKMFSSHFQKAMKAASQTSLTVFQSPPTSKCLARQ